MARCRARTCLRGENLLVLLTAVSVVAGIALGLLVKEYADLSPREIAYFRFPGEIFVRLLKMVILPLIFSSIVSSLASLETKTAGRLGLWTVLYYFTTTISAVILGIILVVAIQPGKHGIKDRDDGGSHGCDGTKPVDTILDLIRNMFPDNIAQAMIESMRTCYKITAKVNGTGHPKQISEELARNITENGQKSDLTNIVFKPMTMISSGTNILGIVVFAVAFGLILGANKNTCQVLLDFFAALETVIMKLVKIIIWYSPIGITFLIAAQIISTKDLEQQMKNLALYMGTVLAGLFIHGFIVIPLLLTFIGRRNPAKFAYGMLQALLTACGTSSSSATLPITLECLEEKNNVHPQVTRFMVPLGATINMDGTALYEAVAAIYIAQAIGHHYNFGHIVIVSITATLASIGAAGIPQAGLVTMIMVLTAVGIDPSYFTLIVPVDWFLDRIRTTINVWGDSCGTAIVERLCTNVLNSTSNSKDYDTSSDKFVELGHVANGKVNGAYQGGDGEYQVPSVLAEDKKRKEERGTTITLSV